MPHHVLSVCSAATWTRTLGPGAPTVSHHFRTLREAGLTHTEVDGRERVVRTRFEDLEARFPGLLRAVLGPAGPERP